MPAAPGPAHPARAKRPRALRLAVLTVAVLAAHGLLLGAAGHPAAPTLAPPAAALQVRQIVEAVPEVQAPAPVPPRAAPVPPRAAPQAPPVQAAATPTVAEPAAAQPLDTVRSLDGEDSVRSIAPQPEGAKLSAAAPAASQPTLAEPAAAPSLIATPQPAANDMPQASPPTAPDMAANADSAASAEPQLVAALGPVRSAAAAVPAASAAASAADAPPPVYPTRLPRAATLQYSVRRGSLSVQGQLRWKPQGNAYEASLTAELLGVSLIEQRSRGALDPNGLAPLRFTDKRRGSSERAANFQREAGKVTFSGAREEYPLVPGAQDRLSWMVQLPAIAAAQPQRLKPGAAVSMMVVGARGDASVWTFVVSGREAQTVQLGGSQKTVQAVHLQRAARSTYDTRVDVWLDPSRDYWPLRAVQTAVPSGDTFELLLLAEPDYATP